MDVSFFFGLIDGPRTINAILAAPSGGLVLIVVSHLPLWVVRFGGRRRVQPSGGESPIFCHWNPEVLVLESSLFDPFCPFYMQVKPAQTILYHLESRFCWWFPHFGDRFRPLTGTTTLLRPGMESRAAAGGLDVAIALAQPGVPGEKIGKTGKMRSMENENGGWSTRNGGFIWFYMGKSWEY